MPPKKRHQPSKTRVQKKTKASQEDQATQEDQAPQEDQTAPRSPTPPEMPVEVNAAADIEEPAAGESEEDARPRKGKVRGKGKGKGKVVAKHDFSLEAEMETNLLEWMVEHDEVWRRGHRLYKKRREIWAAKADELGLELQHIMGWWKSVKDWYVRLTKVKSGQAPKKYTDRERYILDNLQFYKTQLPSTKSDPMVSFPMTSTQISQASDSELDSDQECSPTPQETDLEAVEMTSAQASQSQSSSRQIKKRRKREVDREEEWMKDLRETMKANQQLLTQLIQDRPATSEREAFIKYVGESLRSAPAAKYKKMKAMIAAMIDAEDEGQVPDPTRPAQVMSAPPVLHPQHEMYQQQPQPVQQYQQPQPQTSNSSGDRWSAGSFSQLLSSSKDVLDGSLNLSNFSMDSQLLGGPGSNRRNSGQSLNTPAAAKSDGGQ